MKSRLFKEHAQTEVVTDPQWKGIPGAFITVDIADDQTIIGTNPNNDIFVRTGIDGTWALLPMGGKLKQVSTGGKDKYVGIGMDDRVWSWV
jgi:Tectonin domain